MAMQFDGPSLARIGGLAIAKPPLRFCWVVPSMKTTQRVRSNGFFRTFLENLPIRVGHPWPASAAWLAPDRFNGTDGGPSLARWAGWMKPGSLPQRMGGGVPHHASETTRQARSLGIGSNQATPANRLISSTINSTGIGEQGTRARRTTGRPRVPCTRWAN